MNGMNGVISLRDWGDLGNGLYRNPVLMADYSDPDVIRVGDDYYMVCSEFHYVGMPVLHSRDLVNWRIIGQVYGRLDLAPSYDEMNAYGKGSWAPVIRYHEGRYYVYFCTPDEGLFMTSTADPAGPWAPLHAVCRVAGWEDPCPFWDEDGTAWLGHSTWGAGPIVVHRMSPDGRSLLDDGRIVYVGKVAEGTKLFNREGLYYLSIPEGGVQTGWQTILRAPHILGPYERRVVLQTGRTDINGPHQGALVDASDGSSWFMHFQSRGAIGRVCHLQPVRWVDGWPEIGCGGEPVAIHEMPACAHPEKPSLPQASDRFVDGRLGPQWQWNHNPRLRGPALGDRPGWLSLHARPAQSLLEAHNTLTQKLMGTGGRITVTLDGTRMAPGQAAGLAFLAGREENHIGLVREDGGLRLEAVTGGIRHHGPRRMGPVVRLEALIDLAGETRFAFGMPGEASMPLGGACRLVDGFWKGARPALYSFNRLADEGCADFADFRYEDIR